MALRGSPASASARSTAQRRSARRLMPGTFPCAVTPRPTMACFAVMDYLPATKCEVRGTRYEVRGTGQRPRQQEIPLLPGYPRAGRENGYPQSGWREDGRRTSYLAPRTTYGNL